MDSLTDDMIAAINNADLQQADKKIIKAILSKERQNKERDWDKDAENFIMELIDKDQAAPDQ